ncbi:MAG: gliding motility-associated C-terminal domain-containing protein, partial [Saprospiraceae bacterium]|nr:gliding motility-associated C-terminal domain-containing protein [Saprospiraceae bacterium]
QLEPVTTGPEGQFSNGCSCPYTMDFERTISPREAFPCDEISIQYKITNHSGMGRLGLEFFDELPADLVISEIVGMTSTLSTVRSGVGTSTLLVTNLELLLEDNFITLNARLSESASGSYSMQSTLNGLPGGVGSVLFSDDPSTAEPDDPNVLSVLDPTGDRKLFELEDHLRFSCEGDTAYLRVPLQAVRYNWSTGSTENSIAVTEEGLYWVEVDNGCIAVSDSIQLEMNRESLTVDLGADREVDRGERVELAFTTNAGGSTSVRWASREGTLLSCFDCPVPTFTALADDVFSVTLTDERGCPATDTLLISVNPEKELFVPNAFSPDGDGFNDLFYPQGKAGVVILEMRIFNRWGVEIFSRENVSLNDTAAGWDGNMANRPADSGIYIYYIRIRYADGEEETFSGDIALVR